MRRLALSAALLLVASCSFEPDYPGDELSSLPPNTAGVVTLSGTGIETSSGRSLFFAFDERGQLLGTLEGPRNYSNTPTTFDGGVVATSGEAITVLTPGRRVDVPIDHARVLGRATDGTDVALFFDAGRSSDYVIVNENGEKDRGSVPGQVRATGYCAGSLYAITNDDKLHDIGNGTTIATAATESSISSAVLCRDETPFAIAGAAEFGKPLYPHMADVPADVKGEFRGNAVTLADDNLIWITTAGEVMSTSPTRATEILWTAPTDEALSINGTTLTVVGNTFATYDLLTGQQLSTPIDLPWLDPLIGAQIGDTVYSISGVRSIA